MRWNYRKDSRNQFHSWWYNVAALLEPVYRAFGFSLCLRRSTWTKSGARLTLAWVGW